MTLTYNRQKDGYTRCKKNCQQVTNVSIETSLSFLTKVHSQCSISLSQNCARNFLSNLPLFVVNIFGASYQLSEENGTLSLLRTRKCCFFSINSMAQRLRMMSNPKYCFLLICYKFKIFNFPNRPAFIIRGCSLIA